MASGGHKILQSSLMLILWYWMVFWLPHSWGAQPIPPIFPTDDNSLGRMMGTDMGGNEAPDTVPLGATAANCVNNARRDGCAPGEEGGKRYYSFPDEGTESALLADLLCRIALRGVLEPIVRPATLLELIELLTYSMWCTMVLVGSVVGGVGLTILSWRVYWSVYEASKAEPVTFTFFLSIPGLRYLQNHVRYHLFETPLQPRRRFASFVGAGAYHKFNLDDLDEDVPPTDSKTGARRRKDSMARLEATSFFQQQQANNQPGGKHTRRKSMIKPIDLEVSANAGISATRRHSKSTGTSPDVLRKRHSLSPAHEMFPSLTQMPLIQSAPPSPSELRSPEAVPAANHRRPAVIDEEEEPVPTAFSAATPTVRVEGAPSQERALVKGRVAASEPRSLSAATGSALGAFSSEDGSSEREVSPSFASTAASQNASHRSSSLDLSLASASDYSSAEEPRHPCHDRYHLMHHPGLQQQQPVDRILTPPLTAELMMTSEESTTESTEEEEREQRRPRQRFPKEQSPYRMSLDVPTNWHAPAGDIATPDVVSDHAAPSLTQSKLFRRFNEAGLEQSKLSRYFTQQPSATSAVVGPSATVKVPRSSTLLPGADADASAAKLHEGDLTPPPGFTRRHSSALNHEIQLPYSNSRGKTAADIPEEDDTVLGSSAYHAAFASASQRRRASATPVRRNDSPLGLAPSYGHHGPKVFMEEAPPLSTATEEREGEISIPSWRWFMSEEGNSPSISVNRGAASISNGAHRKKLAQVANDLIWDVPARPHSTIEVNPASTGSSRSLRMAPVGSGTRSTGRVTPDSTSSGAAAEQEQEGEGMFVNPFRRVAREEASINLGIFNDIFSRPPR